MVACLSYSFPTSVGNRNKQLRFCYGDALTSLQNCTTFKQLKQIHARIIRNGISLDQTLLTHIIRFCSSHARVDYAALLFHQAPTTPSTFAWNLMIRSHTLNGSPRRALRLYNLMICRGVPPDKFTFPFAIKACLLLSLPDKAKEVYVLAIKSGFSKDLFLQNTLMDLYYKCGHSSHARKMFDKMRVRNIVSWTTMISGLVDSGDMEAACAVFDQMPARNVVSWTKMIDGYARSGRPYEAFKLFWRMQLDGVKPNEYTLVSMLIACTELGSLKLGKWIHDFALKNGFRVGMFLGTALIDMYSKCGSLEDAKRVFESMETKSTATWNSMITSFGVHGRGEEALDLFREMEREKVEPDAITFVGVLCACVHANLVDEGHRYIEYMKERYGIEPIDEHRARLAQLCSHEDGQESDRVVELVDALAS
ncbi:hypothetical protein NMG60_11025872 [Bertholletia excelsa]